MLNQKIHQMANLAFLKNRQIIFAIEKNLDIFAETFEFFFHILIEFIALLRLLRKQRSDINYVIDRHMRQTVLMIRSFFQISLDKIIF